MQINSQINLQSLAASAVGHLDAGRLDAAADVYRHILSITPGDAHTHYVLGLVYMEMKQLDPARNSFEQAIVYDSRNSRFFRSLGDVLYMSKHVEAALSAYHQALRLAPDDADTLLNLGNALCTTGDHQQALACYWRILAKNPNDSKALNNIGKVCFDHGEVDAAISYYDMAINHQKDYAEAHFNRAAALLSKGDYQNGGRAYAWRFKRRNAHAVSPHRLQGRPWNGRPFKGQRLHNLSAPLKREHI